MSDITLVSKQAYLASPCSALPLPYSVCGGKSLGALHLGGADGAPRDIPANAVSRLIYRPGDMKRLASQRYSVRQLFLKEEPGDMALVASLAAACGVEADIASFIYKPYYNERFCVSVHSRATGECVCAGLGGLDAELHEAWFQCVLIPEGVMGSEAARLLVNELLRRMAPEADIVTACAPHGSNYERLLRKSGFSGGDIWVVNGKLPGLRI